jgi:hypothetical protein
MVRRVQIAIRIGLEPVEAAGAAKMVWRAAKLVTVLRGSSIDLHSADRIDDDGSMIIIVPAVIVRMIVGVVALGHGRKSFLKRLVRQFMKSDIMLGSSCRNHAIRRARMTACLQP